MRALLDLHFQKGEWMRAFFIALIYVVAFSSLQATASADISGSKDHPLISRYPDTHIVQYRVSELDPADPRSALIFFYEWRSVSH